MDRLILVLRSNAFHTMQSCHFKDKTDPDNSKKMMKYSAAFLLESIVDIMGVVAAADVRVRVRVRLKW